MALVENGHAHPSLLSTYNDERQPVAAHLVKESNDILRLDLDIWVAIGLQPYGTSAEDMKKHNATLLEHSKEGRARRKAIQTGTRALKRELLALGTAMGQLYKSTAVYALDEPSQFQPGPLEAQNPQQNYDPCTYPGRRCPHAWLSKRVPSPQVSTLDIAGKGRFTLFIGIGGNGWKHAASLVKKKLGISINVVGIGYGLDWEDVYLDWADKNEIEEDGCVLVRPDFFVAWRAESSGDENIRLMKVMRSVLGFDEAISANV